MWNYGGLNISNRKLRKHSSFRYNILNNFEQFRFESSKIKDKQLGKFQSTIIFPFDIFLLIKKMA